MSGRGSHLGKELWNKSFYPPGIFIYKGYKMASSRRFVSFSDEPDHFRPGGEWHFVQVMTFIDIIGGIFLILFGLRFLRKGFARFLGRDLIDWLQRYTSSRGRSFVGGAIAGTVMPSSTAMAFLSVQMTREGKVAWPHVYSVLLGAQVGITVLIQVLSLNLGAYASIFLVTGGFCFLFINRDRLRGLGQSVLAFGFLLLGMRLISQAARTIGGEPALMDLFAALGNLPVLLLLGAMILTVVMQSSTASIAVALGLAATGGVTSPMLITWVLGTNIGLCLTVLLAGWSRLEGRRLGLAILIVKAPLALGLFFLLFLPSADGWANLPLSLNQQAAWAHTFFNLGAGLSVFFARRMERWVLLILPKPKVPGVPSPHRLDPLLLQSPALALNATMRETMRVFDLLHVLRETIIQGLRNNKLGPDEQRLVHARAQEMATIRDVLNRYLNKIADDELTPHDHRMKDAIDDLMREIPIMIRTLERDSLEEATDLLRFHSSSLPTALPILEEANRRCSIQMETVARMLMQEKAELGEEILQRKQENSKWMTMAKRQHSALPDPAWEIIDDFQQLNRRLSSVAYIYCQHLPLADQL